MRLPDGERFDQARDLFHDHRWMQNKPFMGDEQFAELLVVLAPWYDQEFAQKKAKVSVRATPPKVDKGSESRGRRLVGVRSGGLCEVETELCSGSAREWQHRKNRSQQGTWAASNGLHACRPCHQWIHANPHAAHQFGWTVWSHEDPAERPVSRRGEYVILLDDGGFEPVEKGTAA